MPTIGSETTIAQVLKQAPELRPVLHAHGIDTCCGGSLTLSQAADVRDLDLSALLAELSAAGGAMAEPAPHAAPEAAPDAVPEPALTAAPEPGPLYPRFLTFALLSTLSGGAAFGAYNLAVIHFALGVNPPSHNAFHATFQLFGFALMAIMGVSYQTFPRLLQTQLRHREIAAATFGAMAAGVLLRGYGQFGAMLPATRTATVLGALLLLAGVAGWALCIVATARAAHPAADPFLKAVTAGTAWWVVGAAVVAWAAVSTFLAEDPEAHAAWNEALYVAALLGGALGWIQGMLWRTGPVLLGLPETPAARASTVVAVGQAGTLAAFVGACLPYGRPATVLYNVGLAAVALSFGAFLLGLGLGRKAPHRGTGSVLWIIRAGALMGLLFSALALGHAALELTGRSAPKLLHDGARHAMGLGFLTLVLFGMAGRMLPVFVGTTLRMPHVHAAGAALVLLAALMRQAEVVAGFGGPPGLLALSGASGLVALAGVLACVTSLMATLRTRNLPQKLPVPAGPARGARR